MKRRSKSKTDEKVKRFRELLGADLKELRRLAKWLKIPRYERMNCLELAGAIADKTDALIELEKVHGRQTTSR